MEKQEKKESWIKVFRNIEKSWLWEERPFSRGQAWIDLLLLAKFRDGSFINRSQPQFRSGSAADHGYDGSDFLPAGIGELHHL